MKVKPNQNSGIPAPAQESEANIKDGTSNTILFAESSKSEKAFAKDSFENFRFEMGSLPTNRALDGSSKEAAIRGEATSLKAQDAVDVTSTQRDGEKVVEDLNVKYTMFLGD